MSELTTAEVAAQFGTQISGVEKVNVVTKPEGTVQFTTDPSKPASIGFSSASTTPIEYITGEVGDSLIASSPGLKIFDLRGGGDSARIEGGTFLGKMGQGTDTVDIISATGTIAPMQGRDIINISGDSKVTIEYNAGDLGTPGKTRGSLGNVGKLSERDTIRGFSPDDVLRISRAALPGASLKVGRLRRSDFAVVEGRGAVNLSNAAIVYDSKSGGLFYNPQGAARPVEILRMDAGLDLSRNNIVIF